VALAVCAAMAGCSNDSDSSDTGGPKAVKVEKLKKLTLDCGQNVQIDLVLIPKGKFVMGAPETEKGSPLKERPTREVTLTRPFWMGVTEVTQAQYEAVMGVNSSHTKGANHPVEWVSWNQARQFCQRLSDRTKRTFRLPTEAEWEYAARAGTQTPWFWGNSPNDIGRYAVCKTNAPGSSVTAPVMSKSPNPWGLYDMIGNVWELCHDGDSGGYDLNDTVDPTGNKDNPGIKVARGGSMNYDSDLCRAAYRLAQGVDITLFEVGFRVVCEVE
jgi:formylglycine-generating enzyme required for sulfatase activity